MWSFSGFSGLLQYEHLCGADKAFCCWMTSSWTWIFHHFSAIQIHWKNKTDYLSLKSNILLQSWLGTGKMSFNSHLILFILFNYYTVWYILYAQRCLATQVKMENGWRTFHTASACHCCPVRLNKLAALNTKTNPWSTLICATVSNQPDK